MLLPEFNLQLKELLVEFLWRQWIQLGVHASSSLEDRDGWIIDPEALWLFTAIIGREDPRLFDLSMDWLSANSAFVNLPRLKSLQRKYGFESEHAVAAMAATVRHHNKRLKWHFPNIEIPETPIPLFKPSSPNELIAETTSIDPVFQPFGLLRGPVEFRNLARRFNYTFPECALLRLRALIGLNARAEIYAYLCTHPNGHPSGIARETGYSQKNIQDTITDMSAAHIVFSAQLIGRKKIYLINPHDRGILLYNNQTPPRWISWPPLFRALEVLFLRCRELEKKSTSDLFLSGRLRELTDQLRPLLEREDNPIVLSSETDLMGEKFNAAFFENVLRIFSTELSVRPENTPKNANVSTFTIRGVGLPLVIGCS